jgi:hypothetical protein
MKIVGQRPYSIHVLFLMPLEEGGGGHDGDIVMKDTLQSDIRQENTLASLK